MAEQQNDNLIREVDCSHYQRKCDVKCPDCFQWFTCRLCHNDKVVDHEMNRFKISDPGNHTIRTM